MINRDSRGICIQTTEVKLLDGLKTKVRGLKAIRYLTSSSPEVPIEEEELQMNTYWESMSWLNITVTQKPVLEIWSIRNNSEEKKENLYLDIFFMTNWLDSKLGFPDALLVFFPAVVNMVVGIIAWKTLELHGEINK